MIRKIREKCNYYWSLIIRFFLNRCSVVAESPIIIVGNQKTGSTAIACLLAKAIGQSISYDFLHTYNPPGQVLLFEKQVPFKKLIRTHRCDFSKKIIKELNLVFCMDQLFSYFPDGTFILIIRDPRDNIRSILNRLKLPGDAYELEQPHLENISEIAWKQILDGTIYNTEGRNYIERLANRWKFIIQEYEKYQSRIHLVKYEDFLTDKASYIYQLSRTIGLEPVCDIGDQVNTQYQPKGDHSVSWQDFFGQENLSLIEKICSDKMKTYGYEPVITILKTDEKGPECIQFDGNLYEENDCDS